MPSLVRHVSLDHLLLLSVDASASQNHLEIWLNMLKQRGGHLSLPMLLGKHKALEALPLPS